MENTWYNRLFVILLAFVVIILGIIEIPFFLFEWIILGRNEPFIVDFCKWFCNKYFVD